MVAGPYDARVSAPADHRTSLEGCVRAGAPLLAYRLLPGAQPDEFVRRSFLFGMTIDALRMGEGVLAETAEGRNQNGLRLARHLFEASMTALYLLKFGDRAWRLLLADDAWRRLGIQETEWNGHLAAFEEALANHGDLERAADVEYLGSPLGPWIDVQMVCWAEGRLSDDRVERLEAIPGWAWAIPADDEARTWYRDLHSGWMTLLGYGQLPEVAEAPWMDPHDPALSATRRAHLAALLSRAGSTHLPSGGSGEIDEAAASAPEFKGRLADRKRREDAARERRKVTGARTERLERGEFPPMPELCQALDRPEDHPVLYATTSWIAHPRIQAAQGNLEESAGALGAAATQGAGLDLSACWLAVYALVPMLAEVSVELSLADAVHPGLKAIGWPGPDSPEPTPAA